MNSRTGLVIATLAALLAVVAAYRWLAPEALPVPPEPEIVADAPPAPSAEAGFVESVPTAPAAEPSSRQFALVGDALEAALPDLVKRAQAGDEDALAAIRAGLEDTGNQARERSVLAFAAVADPSAVAELEPLVRDPDSDVRESLVKALVRIGGPDAKPLLMDLALDRDPDVAEDAMQALASAGYTEAIPTIRDVLLHGDPENTVKAASVLRQLGDDASADAALARIAKGLDSPRPIERRETVADIRTIGGAAALKHLEHAYEDPDPAIRREVAAAIVAVQASLEE